jgi:phage-related protein
MAIQTFPITYGPDWQSPRKSATRVLKTEFGDGYGQRVGDGINTVRETWDLNWGSLTPDEATNADFFLRARGGYDAFLWTPPRATVAKKWTCESWTLTPLDAPLAAASA